MDGNAFTLPTDLFAGVIRFAARSSFKYCAIQLIKQLIIDRGICRGILFNEGKESVPSG
jgi:hypothetical protein